MFDRGIGCYSGKGVFVSHVCCGCECMLLMLRKRGESDDEGVGMDDYRITNSSTITDMIVCMDYTRNVNQTNKDV